MGNARILCLGDSNTYGFDPRSCFGIRYPTDIHWVGRLQHLGWGCINCGQNGLQIPRPEEYNIYLDLIKSKEPVDLIIVMLGSNDLLTGDTADTVTSRMDEFLVFMRKTLPKELILLIAPPQMNFGEWVNNKKIISESSKIGECYRLIAVQQQVAFVDANLWNVDLSFDGVHFSPEGHAAFAAGMQGILEQILNTDCKCI